MNNILQFVRSPVASQSIGSALADELQRLVVPIRRKQVVVQLQLAPDVANAACTAVEQQMIEKALEDAVARSPQAGELSVLGFRTPHGIELEVSDEGECDGLQRNNAFAMLPRSQDAFGEPVVGRVVARLPQGGLACTLLLQTPHRRAMAA